MEKADLLLILDVIAKHAVDERPGYGPETDDEFLSLYRLSKKAAQALKKMGVRVKEEQVHTPRGVLTLWQAEPGSAIDVRA